MQRLTFAALVVAACTGSPPITPAPATGAPAPAATAPALAAVADTPALDGGDASDSSDAAPDVATVDAGDGGAAEDAGANAAPRVCSAAADWVPYVVDLGPAENSAAMGNYQKTASDEGRPIRAKLTVLSAPKEVDASNFATYLPYYVAGAYQEAIATRPGLRGVVRVRLVLDATGKSTKVEVRAPGFPATFLDEVRERADTTYVICSPLPAPATLSATITLEPRKPRRPGRR